MYNRVRRDQLQSRGPDLRPLPQSDQPGQLHGSESPSVCSLAVCSGRLSCDSQVDDQCRTALAEFATPLCRRDGNSLELPDQASTNSMHYRRRPAAACSTTAALVNPDYKDFGPRLGLAYSIDPKTVVRAGYGISYTFFNRVGSALEGINAPAGACSGDAEPTASPRGRPRCLPRSSTTQNSFTTGIANPSSFNPVNSNVVYVPKDSQHWPYGQNWFPLGPARADQRTP